MSNSENGAVPARERHIFCHLRACQAMGQGANLLDIFNQPEERYRQSRRVWPRRFGTSGGVMANAISEQHTTRMRWLSVAAFSRRRNRWHCLRVHRRPIRLTR